MTEQPHPLRHPLIPHAVRLIVFAGAAAFVLWASLVPTRDLPSVTFWDKAEHAIAYFGLCFLGVWALPRRRLAIAGGLIALGIGVEVLQANMGLGRQGDPMDALANSLGVAVGLVSALAARAFIHWLWPRLTARFRG